MKAIFQVRRIAAPALEGFQRDYVLRGEPVILTGIARHWPAFPMMTPNVLKQTFGEITVPVRESDDELNYFFGQSGGKSTMKLADYIDTISGPPSRGQTRPYLGNIPFDHPLTRQYLQRLKAALPFPDYFPNQIYGDLRIWIGAAGQRSTIHNDNYHNLNAQLYGRKRFLLFAPEQYQQLYTSLVNETCWASPVDPDRPDYAQYPRFQDAEPREAILEAGDMLYIPIFWWHYVVALDLSISVSRFSYLSQTQLWTQPDTDHNTESAKQATA
ncbi:MAG TPA: cupin-like domain-containing protein [Pyrinomonadaceae bacterium]|nr:cupin-like domain-containing protein [Pyrinomonadaceae bacterium]